MSNIYERHEPVFTTPGGLIQKAKNLLLHLFWWWYPVAQSVRPDAFHLTNLTLYIAQNYPRKEMRFLWSDSI